MWDPTYIYKDRSRRKIATIMNESNNLTYTYIPKHDSRYYIVQDWL